VPLEHLLVPAFLKASPFPVLPFALQTFPVLVAHLHHEWVHQQLVSVQLLELWGLVVSATSKR
jgi:hypothetical protein